MIAPNFVHVDDRGSLTQLFRDGYKQVNVITCKNGSIRGGHYHKKNIEAFFVISGSFTLELSKDGETEKHHIDTGVMFTIDPYVTHTFYYEEDTILVSAYSNGVELPDGNMDIFKKDD